VEVVLAGDGEMRDQLETLIAANGLAKQVTITGWISAARVSAEILSARALVLPSFAEGLPVVIMEAMALRRPVLTTFVAGIPELVVAGVSGWLFPAGDVAALAAAIEDAVTRTPEELKRMGDAAYARVIERHSIDSEAAKLARLFQQTSARQVATSADNRLSAGS
jgi:glycosyltransferase involved in cell wall biosynthesis